MILRAEYIQDCSNGSDVLDYYADREYSWQSAGKAIKKAIADLEMGGWFPFNMKTLNSRDFTVQRMKYNGDLYAIVTNSAINYIFKIHTR